MWHVGFDMCSILIWPPLEKKCRFGSLRFECGLLGVGCKETFHCCFGFVFVDCSGRMCGFPLGLSPNGSLLLLGMGFP